MKGPYFNGQKSAECGHYFPDVLSEVDLKTRDGEYLRILNCKYCGRYEIPIDPMKWSRKLIEELDQKGFRLHINPREIPQIREKELKRITS